MKFLPRGISTFKTIIEQNYLYVDKTKEIYNLFATGDRYFFLSRPRRFGKSLLLSTLKELFEANRPLFTGLWIETSSSYQWPKHPVITLDMSAIPHEDAAQFKEQLANYIVNLGSQYGIILHSNAPAVVFDRLVRALFSQHGPVVILIDEYDKPLIDHITDQEKTKEIRKALQAFYEILKSLDACLRAIFITGVSKFSKTSIFSGLNNLVDITLSQEGSTLLGYTQQEIIENFMPHLEHFAHAKNRTINSLMEEMTTWYNGYCFHQNAQKVFNPFSILYYLKNHEARNYWFESGTPTFLGCVYKILFQP